MTDCASVRIAREQSSTLGANEEFTFIWDVDKNPCLIKQISYVCSETPSNGLI